MQKTYSQIIFKRKSIRNYDGKRLNEDDKQNIQHFINNLSDLPFGIKARFNIIDTNLGNSKIKLGTYGFIKNTNSFITAAVKHENYSLESLGYQMEKIVLYATSLGLGTCWLGGTFNRGRFAKAINIKADEFLPIVLPIGYSAKKQSLSDKIVRRSAGSDNRKSWNDIFYLNNFNTPLTEEDSKIYKNAFEMVRLAPSASNKQPWLLVLDNDKKTIHFYLKKLKSYVGNRLGFEMQKIDMGIAASHLELALADDSITGKFEICNPKIELLKMSGSIINYAFSFKVK